jgi:hypothetical protein
VSAGRGLLACCQGGKLPCTVVWGVGGGIQQEPQITSLLLAHACWEVDDGSLSMGHTML